MSASEQAVTGIKGVQSRPRVLAWPSDTPDDQVWIYGTATPFQLSPTEVGLFANIGRKDLAAQNKKDVEAGSDLIIFDDFDCIAQGRVIPLQRGENITDPKDGGPRYMSSYPITGGFVPLGAKRADGSPHPHAGTGFGINCEWGYPLDQDGGPEVLDHRIVRNRLQQFTYDGQAFKATPSDAIEVLHPLSCAIPDGDDLLMVVMNTSPDNELVKQSPKDTGDVLRVVPNQRQTRPMVQFLRGMCVIRWRFEADRGWQVVECMPLPAPADMGEASLIRDVDGALMVTARPLVHDVYDIFVWRSYDSGKTWEKLLQVKDKRRATVSINQSLDGTPYITSCATQTPSGEVRAYREGLHLWPFAPDRRSLLEPIVVRDTIKEWGLTDKGTNIGKIRQVDHHTGRTVRLKDGKWRHILAYRVWGKGEAYAGMDRDATTIPGVYVDEVLSDGEPHPEWQF